MHRLERRSQRPRVGDELALRLREEMDARGLTAKEVARLVVSRTGYSLDYRSVQNAMAGSCSLDTAGVLSAAFGWNFLDDFMEPVMRVSRLAALEREYDEQRAAMAALDRTIAVHRLALQARPVLDGGWPRLATTDDRPAGASAGVRAPAVGSGSAPEDSR